MLDGYSKTPLSISKSIYKVLLYNNILHGIYRFVDVKWFILKGLFFSVSKIINNMIKNE